MRPIYEYPVLSRPAIRPIIRQIYIGVACTHYRVHVNCAVSTVVRPPTRSTVPSKDILVGNKL